MIEHADVFVSNVRPQAREHRGLGYAKLSERIPKLIYCGCYAHPGTTGLPGAAVWMTRFRRPADS